MHLRALLLLPILSALVSSPASGEAPAKAAALPYPILFVTQFPIADDFTTIGSTFGNHEGRVSQVGRGGDLYIRYTDGTLRNLTREAGYGTAAVHQGAGSIAVRDPSVHWDGERALFSMVTGAPPERYVHTNEKWQIYEVTGLGAGEAVAIVEVPHQPAGYNNVTPVYGSDGRIIFTSDRPRGGEAHLYPQHDEYESADTNTGLWSLDPSTGDLALLQHSPSGSFTPIVDSYGRIVFTRWDHLQRDQQADGDALSGTPTTLGTFNYASESAGAAALANRDEVFPEPRADRADLLAGMHLQGHPVRGHTINHFFPWEIHQDGTVEETLNHVGRHDLHDYFDRSLSGDPNVDEFIAGVRFNPNSILNMFQIEEDPNVAGRYFGVEAPEFQTHASGQVIRLDAPKGQPADQIAVVYVTHPATATVVDDGATPPAAHSGHYRDPLPLADGRLVAAHTSETREAANEGTRTNPDPRYDFRLEVLGAGPGGYLVASTPLTTGISRHVTYWDPDELVSYDGPFWELSPVEVRPRPQPPYTSHPEPEPPELQAFADAGVDPDVFRAYLAERNLAVAVSRNVTTRDAGDEQQPFNLSIPGGVSTAGVVGEAYEIKYMQFFQGDQIRGIGGSASPRPGRRVIAQVMHDPAAPPGGSGGGVSVENPPTTGPPGSVALGADGSMAAIVPARRAMAWQLTSADGTPVVRERYWITFQPGEIRLCTSCHGLSSVDHGGATAPQNVPEALTALVEYWDATFNAIFADGFESGDVTAWSQAVGSANP
jgi:hypothetical protein